MGGGGQKVRVATGEEADVSDIGAELDTSVGRRRYIEPSLWLDIDPLVGSGRMRESNNRASASY